MKPLPGVNRAMICLTSFARPHYLERVIPMIAKRTLYPHNVVVAHGWREGGKEDEVNRRCIDYLKKAKVEGLISEVLFAGELGFEENPGQCRLQGVFLKWLEENAPDTEWVVMTQDDLEPPEVKPCWLEQQIHLAEKNPDYAFLAARIERTSRLSWDESQDEIIQSHKSVPAVLRISRLSDLQKMGGSGLFLNGPKHWESHLAMGAAEKIHKHQGFNARLYCSHWGYRDSVEGNAGKGYLTDADYESAHTYSPERKHQADFKPYPDIDPKTLEPLPFQAFRHDKEEFAERRRFWDEKIGVQAEGTVESPRRQLVRAEVKAIVDANAGKWLDVGCGAKKLDERMDGLDMWPYDCANYVGDAFAPWFIADGEYDGIASSHVLEHAKMSPKDALKAWDRILKPGGLMVIVVPDGENRPSTICEPSHAHAFSREVLRLLMKRVMNYEVIRCDNVAGLPENKKDIIVVARKVK